MVLKKNRLDRKGYSKRTDLVEKGTKKERAEKGTKKNGLGRKEYSKRTD